MGKSRYVTTQPGRKPGRAEMLFQQRPGPNRRKGLASMATNTHTTSRRSLLGALALSPAALAFLAAAPAEAEAETIEEPRDPCDMGEDWHAGHAAGYESGHEIAILRIARAWIDRWEALGGNFGLMYNRDGTPKSVLRGMLMAQELWTKPDEGRADLPPHTWLTDWERQHDGAVKVLEGLLVLVPGLRDAVLQCSGYARYMDDLRRTEA